jgi:hypothetical protein
MQFANLGGPCWLFTKSSATGMRSEPRVEEGAKKVSTNEKNIEQHFHPPS